MLFSEKLGHGTKHQFLKSGRGGIVPHLNKVRWRLPLKLDNFLINTICYMETLLTLGLHLNMFNHVANLTFLC